MDGAFEAAETGAAKCDLVRCEDEIQHMLRTFNAKLGIDELIKWQDQRSLGGNFNAQCARLRVGAPTLG